MTINDNIVCKFQLERTDEQKCSAFKLAAELEFPARGITAIFGHSGSGKTTLLRLISGLEKVDNGYLSVQGNIWQDQQSFVNTENRNLGYVFQEPSLFAHLTVDKNLHFAIKRAKHAVDKPYYQDVISVMGLEQLLNKIPSQLSGGEQQRVAIARSLLSKPQLLLMDEPLASLDYTRKQEILPYLEKLHQHFALPIIYVSHAMDEVTRLADHAIVLKEGQVITQGAINEVFSRNDLPFEHHAGVVISGEISALESQWHLAKFCFGDAQLWLKDDGYQTEQTLKVQIQAKDVSISKSDHQDSSVLNRIQAEITSITDDNSPALSQVALKIGQHIIVASITQYSLDKLSLKVGDKVWAQIKSVAILG